MEKRVEVKFVWDIFLKNWLLLIAMAMLFGASMFFYAKLAITPQYRSSMSFYVEANEKTEGQTISNTDVTAATKLVETCKIIITCDTMMGNLAANVDVDYTPAQLKEMISVSAVGSTQCFNVRVTSPDCDDAYNIAKYITDYAPTLYRETVQFGALNLYNEPLRNPAPVSPNVKKYVLFGFCMGFVLAYVIVFLRDVLDTRLTDDDDLFKIYNIPMFVELPDFNVASNKGYGYGGYEHVEPTSK